MDWNFKFDDEIREINCFNGLFHLFASIVRIVLFSWKAISILHSLNAICLWGYQSFQQPVLSYETFQQPVLSYETTIIKRPLFKYPFGGLLIQVWLNMI